MVKQKTNMRPILPTIINSNNILINRIRTNSRYNFRKTPLVNYKNENHGIIRLNKNKFINRKINIETRQNKSIIQEKNSKNIWNDFNKLLKIDGINKNNINYKKEWVSASAVKNYLLKDPSIDWIKEYYVKKGYTEYSNNIPNKLRTIIKDQHEKQVKKEKDKLSILFEKGNKFEDEVLSYLKNKYPNSFKTVVTSTRNIKPEDMGRTIEFMKQGIPIIEQAVLYNYENYTFGAADILIRSDWINKIFEQEVLTNDEINIKSPKLGHNYHYIVIDIKWTTLHLCANGLNIRNSNRFPAYKGQLAIYNAAIGLIQGYTPLKAYILAKGWNYQKNNIKYTGKNCFDLLGEINYETFDSNYIELTKKAIKWVREVRYNGHKWTMTPPSVPELYPNMCNRYDIGFHGIKNQIADENDELTQIWMVGVRNREVAHNNGIFKWSDPECNAEIMGIRGKKIAPIVDQIIHVNRDNLEGYVYPSIIKNNVNDWHHKHTTDFYVDFESINGDFYESNMNIEDSSVDNGVVFMIGVGWERNNKWYYQCFTMDSYNRNEEMKAMDQFTNFIKNQCNRTRRKPTLFHWGNAELTLFNNVNKRHNYRWSNWYKSINWLDMCKVFTEEPIIVKGAKKFGIKVVANAMRHHNLIEVGWDRNGPSDGLNAMLEAADYYKFIEGKINSTSNDNKYNLSETNKQEELFKSIIKYNEVDCKALWEIINYLRKNNTK